MRCDPVDVLLVEDSVDDIELFSLAISRVNAPMRLARVADADEALLYLEQKAPYRQARLPHMLVLDINLPKRNGIELLKEIKRQPKWRTIPVVMLSTSDSLEEIGQSYCEGASCYLTKPADLPGWLNLVEAMAKLWTRVDLASGYVCR